MLARKIAKGLDMERVKQGMICVQRKINLHKANRVRRANAESRLAKINAEKLVPGITQEESLDLIRS